jgi:hypothetical protein
MKIAYRMLVVSAALSLLAATGSPAHAQSRKDKKDARLAESEKPRDAAPMGRHVRHGELYVCGAGRAD